jgi:hypothetical protein
MHPVPRWYHAPGRHQTRRRVGGTAGTRGTEWSEVSHSASGRRVMQTADRQRLLESIHAMRTWRGDTLARRQQLASTRLVGLGPSPQACTLRRHGRRSPWRRWHLAPGRGRTRHRPGRDRPREDQAVTRALGRGGGGRLELRRRVVRLRTHCRSRRRDEWQARSIRTFAERIVAVSIKTVRVTRTARSPSKDAPQTGTPLGGGTAAISRLRNK